MAYPLPNFGRPSHLGPVSLSEWKYPDPDADLDVKLVVVRARPGLKFAPEPRDNHWMLIWAIGQTSSGNAVHRRVHVVQEHGVDHLTHWGPITTAAGSETAMGVHIHVARMSREGRARLEEIANATPVMAPDGEWNCQSWIESVLVGAADAGLVSPEALENTLTFARRVQPLRAK